MCHAMIQEVRSRSATSEGATRLVTDTVPAHSPLRLEVAWHRCRSLAEKIERPESRVVLLLDRVAQHGIEDLRGAAYRAVARHFVHPRGTAAYTSRLRRRLQSNADDVFPSWSERVEDEIREFRSSLIQEPVERLVILTKNEPENGTCGKRKDAERNEVYQELFGGNWTHRANSSLSIEISAESLDKRPHGVGGVGTRYLFCECGEPFGIEMQFRQYVAGNERTLPNRIDVSLHEPFNLQLQRIF